MQHTQPPRRRRDVGELRTISSDWTRTNHKWQLVKKPKKNNNNILTFGRVERTNGAPEKKKEKKKKRKRKEKHVGNDDGAEVSTPPSLPSPLFIPPARPRPRRTADSPR